MTAITMTFDLMRVVIFHKAESVQALLKHGIIGTFHHVSKKHLHRYLNEFDFRFNNRKIKDGERTIEAIRNVEGKRLTYRTPLRKQK